MARSSSGCIVRALLVAAPVASIWVKVLVAEWVAATIAVLCSTPRASAARGLRRVHAALS